MGLGAGLQRPKKAKSKDHESDQEEKLDKSSKDQQSPAVAKEEAADATETAADIKPPSGLQSYLSKCLKVTTKQSCHQIVLVSQCRVLHLEISALYVKKMPSKIPWLEPEPEPRVATSAQKSWSL